MSIQNIRDPRDFLPDILRPSGNAPALDETAYVQAELGDDGFRVMFNHERQKFVVMDTKAPGGPSAAYVMVVQNEDGSFRPVDERTIKTLRKMLGQGHKASADELIQAELSRERQNKSRRESVASAVASDFKWFGRGVTPTTGWRDRSLARDQIRKEAGL